MDLPKKKFKKQKGQVLVIFLLIIVMALAVVLSVASRTITDIRTTSTTDESNRAYFAAESGIEEGLQRVASSPATIIPFNTNFSNAKATTSVRAYAPTNAPFGNAFTNFMYPENVAKDSVAQIMMMSNPGDPSTGWSWPDNKPGPDGFVGNQMGVYWGADPTKSEAIEISLIYYDGTSYGVQKFSFDSDPTRATATNVCPAIHGNQTYPGTKWSEPITDYSTGVTKSYAYNSGSTQVRQGSWHNHPTCSRNTEAFLTVNQKIVLVRIRPLYNENPTPIAFWIEQGMPSQGSIIESTGKTDSGVTRKIQAVQLFSALPSLYDNVLFVNGDLSK